MSTRTNPGVTTSNRSGSPVMIPIAATAPCNLSVPLASVGLTIVPSVCLDIMNVAHFPVPGSSTSCSGTHESSLMVFGIPAGRHTSRSASSRLTFTPLTSIPASSTHVGSMFVPPLPCFVAFLIFIILLFCCKIMPRSHPSPPLKILEYCISL